MLLGELRDTIERVLERSSLIKRLSAGTTSDVQLIAANVDTLFIVSSCNEDFNLSRIERYLALALDAGVRPVIVLTKVDLVDDHQGLIEQVHTLRSDLVVEGVVATRADTLGNLLPWCASGQTVALLGSSGVGKSTLVNSLSGEEVQTTAGVREDDGRGRHTTTHRSLHPLARGGLLLDSPGMRELGIVDAQAGVGQLFEDIDDLSRRCRFSDCAHAQEPGCAVRAAIESSELDERRFESYQKLLREEMYNTETIAERHTRSRQFGKMVRQHLAHSHKKR